MSQLHRLALLALIGLSAPSVVVGQPPSGTTFGAERNRSDIFAPRADGYSELSRMEADFRSWSGPVEDSLEPRWPMWIISGEAIFLRRRNTHEIPLIASSGSAPLTTDDLRSDFAPGIRLRSEGRPFERLGVELAFSTMDDWSATASRDGEVILGLPGVSLPSVSGRHTLLYESTWDSVGVCIKFYQRRWLAWTVGASWMQFEDLLNGSRSTGGPPESIYRVATSNNLLGFETGTELRWSPRAGRFWIDGEVKAAIYQVDGDAELFISSSLTSAVDTLDDIPSQGSLKQSDVAFSGRCRFGFGYRILENWTCHFGYEVFWVDGIALAPAQLEINNNATGFDRLELDGTIFVHGFQGAITAEW